MLDEFAFGWILLFLGGLSSIAIVVLLLIGLVVGLIKMSRRNQAQILEPLSTQKPPWRYPKRWAIATGITILFTLVLLRLNLPQIIAFSFSRPAFDAFVANTEQVERLCAHPYRTPEVSQQLGLYPVLTCDRPSQGGIYLKTYEGGFFSTENYGFAYQPNAQGSDRFGRVGRDGYEHGRVIGDWYWFMGVRDTF